MNKGQFKKGKIPWNKDKKGIHLSPASEFKSMPLDKHYKWQGGVQYMTKDCVYIQLKTKERLRRPKYIYEQKHGKIPHNYVIYHIDGNKHNDDISNLEAISRAELMRRNIAIRKPKSTSRLLLRNNN